MSNAITKHSWPKRLIDHLVFLAAMLVATSALAQDVWITPTLNYAGIQTDAGTLLIQRDQDTTAVISDTFALTSRKCPPACVQPMSAGEGVETVGELEVIAFLQKHSQTRTGFLIDTRTADWFRGGTIAGSHNFAFNVFDNLEVSPFAAPLLVNLGGEQSDDGSWTFTDAIELMLYCNGPWCGQSYHAIQNLLAFGYPSEKLFYYRGGKQNWVSMGFTVTVSDEAKP